MKIAEENEITAKACLAAARLLYAAKSKPSKTFTDTLKQVHTRASSKEGLRSLLAELEDLKDTKKGSPSLAMYSPSYVTMAVSVLKIKAAAAPEEKTSPDLMSDEEERELIRSALNRAISSPLGESIIRFSVLEKEDMDLQMLVSKMQALLTPASGSTSPSGKKVTAVLICRDSPEMAYMERKMYYKKQMYLTYPHLPFIKITVR